MENSILSSHPPSVTSRLDCPAPQSRNHTHEIPERVISNAFSGCMENLWSQHPGICILARILKCLCLLKSENYKSWIFHFNGVSPFIRIHYKGGGWEHLPFHIFSPDMPAHYHMATSEQSRAGSSARTCWSSCHLPSTVPATPWRQGSQ